MGAGAGVAVQAWGQVAPPVQDSSAGIWGLPHCPVAVLTAAPGPKVPFVSPPCCHRHHVAVCFAALKMALPPPSSWGCHPPGAVARVRHGLRPGQRGRGRHQNPAALCSLPGTAEAAGEATLRSDHSPAAILAPGCHRPRAAAAAGQPVPQLSPGSGSPSLRGFGAQGEDTSHAPPSEAPLPLPCWLALGDL